MKYLLILALFLSCNSGKTPETQNRSIAKATEWPYVILQNGDSLFQIEKEDTFIFNTLRNELHPFEGDEPPPPPDNQRPVAKAGPDQVITGNSVTLDARSSSDADGTIDFLWTKAAGTGSTIQSSNNALTQVTGLSKGIYRYRVAVTDDDGAISSDEVQVTVNDSPVPPPPPPTPTPGTTTTFTVQQIPFSDPDFSAPGRGAEQWHDRNDVNLGHSSQDVYWRFAATRISGSTKGTYNWSYFDGLFEQAKAKKQKVSFGIMTCYPDGLTDYGLVSFSNGTACYPQWLHNEMQAESVKDWRTGSTWTPNYNSAKYLQWLTDLNKAINDHIYQKGYQNMITAIDIRGYGAWGEWHSGYTDNNVVSDYPSGTFPKLETLKKIVDAHTQGFPNFQLVCMFAAFDCNRLGNTKNPPEIARYILDAKNTYGPIGWRRDQWGALDDYIQWYLEKNPYYSTEIMNRYKIAPVTGEPPSWIPEDYRDLERQVRLYHAASFGNGNYGTNSPNSTIQSRVKASSKASGYRLSVTSGSITTGTSGKISVNWSNSGIAPTYENWNVVYELKSGSAVTWTGASSFKLRLFLPGTVTHTDNFNIPTGAYTLTVKAIDPAGYRAPLVLAVKNRNADGSYILKQ